MPLLAGPLSGKSLQFQCDTLSKKHLQEGLLRNVALVGKCLEFSKHHFRKPQRDRF